MKKCSQDKILNPETKRCVLRTGAIGKLIVKQLEQSDNVKKTLTKKVKPDPLRDIVSAHTFTPEELDYLLILLQIQDNNTDKFTQIRHHLAEKFCKCVEDISEKNAGKQLQYPPEQTCRYSIFNKRGLASHKISCWEDKDGSSVYNPQLLSSQKNTIVLSKGNSWQTGWEEDHRRKGLIKRKS